MLQHLFLKNVGGNSLLLFIPPNDGTLVGRGLSAMLLVVWGIRLELNVRELGFALVAFMFAVLLFVFNEVHTRNVTRVSCTDICVVPSG